jgi:hypothetical protein
MGFESANSFSDKEKVLYSGILFFQMYEAMFGVTEIMNQDIIPTHRLDEIKIQTKRGYDPLLIGTKSK